MLHVKKGINIFDLTRHIQWKWLCCDLSLCNLGKEEALGFHIQDLKKNIFKFFFSNWTLMNTALFFCLFFFFSSCLQAFSLAHSLSLCCCFSPQWPSTLLLGRLNFARAALLKHTFPLNGSILMKHHFVVKKICFAANFPNLFNFSIPSSWANSALNYIKKQPKTLFWKALKVWHHRPCISYKYHSTVYFHFSQSLIYELKSHHWVDFDLWELGPAWNHKGC